MVFRFLLVTKGNNLLALLAPVTSVLLAVGCSGSSSPASSVGGAPEVGGSTSSSPIVTGGSSSTSAGQGGASGGIFSSVAASITGGAVSTGGGPNQGGALASGGLSNTGGAHATGGMKSTGGGTAAGGFKSTGGIGATGGTKSSGGTTANTGGSKSLNSTAAGGTTQVTGNGGALSTGGGKNAGGTTNAGATTSVSGGATSAAEFCARWTTDRADLSESGWTGSVDTCTPGDMTETSRANALRQVNLFRWIAGLGPVTTSDQYDQQDQACALMMDAQDDLSHSPDSTWKCYTSSGATAAQNSCISGEGAVAAVLGYMVDPGNATTLGHRRWILSNYLGPIGIGSTGKYSCMYTGTTGKLTNAWTAWPAPGFFPMEAAADTWKRSINTTGFSVQSDTINLANASVAITLNDAPLNATVTQLAANYGSKYAISIVPSGWTIAAGNTYHVSITGVSSTIAYDIQVVTCG